MKYITTFERKIQLTNQKELDSKLYEFCSNKSALQLIRELISKGANVNYKSSNGRTPLITAATNRFYSAIELLIENGADVNIADNAGNTAFILLGCIYRFGGALKETVDLFIENNVDLTHANNRGIDAFHAVANSFLKKYIQEKYPEKYENYLDRKEAEKYNL